MLKPSLIAAAAPAADERNVIQWRDYRVTVLGSRLFRLEKNRKKQFRDEATQVVWFRNMEQQSFTFSDNGDTAVIDTGECRLLLAKKRQDCRIRLDGTCLKIDNRGNLGGTARTLDCCDGGTYYASGESRGQPVRIDNGVCSRSGVAVLSDAESLTLGADGQVKPRRAEGSDEYIFAYGSDYRGAVQALYRITGAVPRIPRFALGNWWSRYHAYTDKEYLRLLGSFEEREVPLTVATVDMDWHYSGHLNPRFHMDELGRDTPEYGGDWGWTGYSWNRELFPDYRAFLKKIQQKNLKITLNLHPADGVRWFEDQYAQMAQIMGIDPESAKPVQFDITDPKFINAYFDVLHKPYEQDGVAFWWIDWQQGFNTKIPGLDPLWSLNHYHYLDNGENHDVPLILSRYSGIGAHRYPLGFSGDTHVTWKTLRYLPWFTANATNAGYTWWSHDIGGHMYGHQDNEMFLRHVQYGVFSPINRLHCNCWQTFTKEPWIYENGTGKIAEDFLRLRHALIPFLYTQSWRTNTQGKALIEPLYYRWNCDEAYEFQNEYLFGDLLVAPVTEPMKKDGFARVKAWIPEGTWTDIFTGDCYEAPAGGKRVTMLRRLESIPVLAKAGTVLPLSADKGNACGNPHKLKISVYRGDGEFTLYEDGPEGEAFTDFRTYARMENGSAVQTLEISARGASGVIPGDRSLRVLFRDIPDGAVTLYRNGEQVQTQELLTSCAGVEFSFEAGAQYRVEAVYQPMSVLQARICRAREVLLRAEEDHLEKHHTFRAMEKAADPEEWNRILEASKLSSVTKQRLLETIL